MHVQQNSNSTMVNEEVDRKPKALASVTLSTLEPCGNLVGFGRFVTLEPLEPDPGTLEPAFLSFFPRCPLKLHRPSGSYAFIQPRGD